MADTPNIDPRFTWQQGDVRPIPDPTVLTGAAVTTAKEDLRREMESRDKILGQRVEDLVHRVDLVSHRVDDLPKDSESRLAGLRETLLQHLSSTDRAVALLQDEIRQVFAQIGVQVGGLRDLHKQVFDERFNSLGVKMDERFASIENQFSLRDTRVTATAEQVKEAMANTLSAQSKLVDQQNTANSQAAQKSEDSFTKQIGALDNKIGILAEQTKTTMTREEVQQLFRTISDKIDGPTGLAMRFENLIARTLGQEEAHRRSTGTNQWAVGAIIGGLGLIISLVVLFLRAPLPR